MAQKHDAIRHFLKFITGSEAWGNKTEKNYFLIPQPRFDFFCFTRKPRSHATPLIYRKLPINDTKAIMHTAPYQNCLLLRFKRMNPKKQNGCFKVNDPVFQYSSYKNYLFNYRVFLGHVSWRIPRLLFKKKNQTQNGCFNVCYIGMLLTKYLK